MKDLKIVSKSQKKSKKDLTADTVIHLLVDASGSMGSIVPDTLGGINGFIKEQKEDIVAENPDGERLLRDLGL